MSARGSLIPIVLGWLCIYMAAPATAADEPEPGRVLLEATCTQCHGLAPIVATRNGPSGWNETVQKMIAWGAQVRTQAEATAMVDYLARTYGASAGPMQTGLLPPGAAVVANSSSNSQRVALPPGKGAELVQSYCTMCHDLGRIVATRRTADSWQQYTVAMLAKTSINPPAGTLRTISAYLTSHFGVRDEQQR